MLTIVPSIILTDDAPGPHTEILVSGITMPGVSTNVVPDPSITSTTIWGTIIAGTYAGITAPTVSGVWSRSTTAFATTPASLRSLTITNGSSGFCYLCPWTPAVAGNTVVISASVRVTVADARQPRIVVVAKDSANVETIVGSVSWPSTVNAAFTTLSNNIVLPDGTVSFRAYIHMNGVATVPTTVYWDDFNVALKQDASKITIQRQWEGNDVAIQGGVNTEVLGGSMLFYDFAVPFGVSVSYTAVTSDRGVTKDQGTSSIIQVDVQGVWLSDPIVPEMAIKVIPDAFSFRTKTLSREGGPVRLIGRQTPIAIVAPRQAPTNIPFSILTYTNLQTFALELLLVNTDPIMLRSSKDHNLPSLAYITADDIVVEYLDAPDGETSRTSMTIALVSSPGLDVLVPIRTYALLPAEMTTYGDNPYVSYLAQLRGS